MVEVEEGAKVRYSILFALRAFLDPRLLHLEPSTPSTPSTLTAKHLGAAFPRECLFCSWLNVNTQLVHGVMPSGCTAHMCSWVQSLVETLAKELLHKNPNPVLGSYSTSRTAVYDSRAKRSIGFDTYAWAKQMSCP